MFVKKDNKEDVFECGLCSKKGVLQVEDICELFCDMMEIVECADLDEIAIVADVETTKELLYHAVNDDYEIGFVELDPYGYGDLYMTTIMWNGACYEVMIEQALLSNGEYMSSDALTFVQFDAPEKCDYVVNLVTREKDNDLPIEFFVVGSDDDPEDDESEDDDDEYPPDDYPPEHVSYTYGNKYEDGEDFATIFVESNIKDFVDMVRDDYESVFEDD